MIKNNKWNIIFALIVILIPMIFGIIVWDKLPESLTVHWDIENNADAVAQKAFAVFAVPMIFFAGELICLVATCLDSKNQQQNKKALGIVFWIIPFISLFVNGIIYSFAFGREFDTIFIVPIILGVMFVVIGNYMPKVKQNRTLGIKITWTLLNEENWDKTHRFSGKLWVAGGFVLMLSAFLPQKAIIPIFICIMVTMMVMPMIYSYKIYRNHLKKGISYTAPPKTKRQKYAYIAGIAIASVIVILTCWLMFSGDIEVDFGKTAMTIKADYWSDARFEYAKIENLNYHEKLEAGIRTFGFGSARLLMGNFKNDRYGEYTRYSYTADSCITFEYSGRVVAIGAKDAQQTQAIYRQLTERLG